MSNVVSLPNKRDWKWHRDRIAAAWGKQVESIIETGQMLIEAKEELPHGSFEAMVQSELPFKCATATKLRLIAKHPIISNPSHAKGLPASWNTLYELTRLPQDQLLTKLKNGSIHPKIERKDVRAMRPGIEEKPPRASREELIAAIQKDPMANQRDAAAALGVSLGVYQRTRNELIGSGQIKANPLPAEPPATIDPQAQRDEMRRSYVTFLQTLSKEDQVEELGKIIRRELVGWSTKEISALLKITSFNIKLK